VDAAGHEATPPVEPLVQLPAPSGWRRVGQWLAEVVAAVIVVVAADVAVFDGPIDYARLLAVIAVAGVFAVLLCRPRWPREHLGLGRAGIVGKASWARMVRVEVWWRWHEGRVVRLVLDDGTRVPVGVVGTLFWPDKPFVTNVRRLVHVAREHNPTITVRNRFWPLSVALFVAALVVSVGVIRGRDRDLISPWEPTASGPVPACAALTAEGGRRWPGGVWWQNDDTPGRDFTYCTWGFIDDAADRTWLMKVEVDVVAHRWFATRSPVAAAMSWYGYDRDAMLGPQPLPGVGDEASIATHTDFVEIVARRANVTLGLRLHYCGAIPPARATATAIAADTLNRARLRSVLEPVPHITRQE
jgi:hypothetical protein